jgi:hypothetical protein
MWKNLQKKLQFIFLYFWYYKEFTQQYDYENHNKSLYLSCLLKLSINYSKSSMVCWNEIKTTRLNLWYIKNKICGFCYKIFTPISLLQNYVFKSEFFFPKLPSLGSPQITINMIQNQKKIQNLNLQCPMINPYL